MDRPSREACEERAFRDAVGVEVSKTGHGLGHDSVQVPVLCVRQLSVCRFQMSHDPPNCRSS